MRHVEATSGVELYVYYRVPVGAAQTAAAEIEALHQTLKARWPGLQTRRLVRVDTAGEDQTWMEVFASGPGLDGDALASIRAAGASWPSARSGPRHEECFAAAVGAG